VIAHGRCAVIAVLGVAALRVGLSLFHNHGSSRLRDGICSPGRKTPYLRCERRRLAANPNRRHRGTIMKTTILTALIALSLLTGVAASASAFDGQKFWQEHATSGER
jgi:hypothetical protein